MAANYDHIARIYDALSRIVFGQSIVKAQVCLIPHIKPGSKILIVGGGTGWIIERITESQSAGLVIDYVESSQQMIRLSQKRKAGSNTIHIIHAPIESFPLAHDYDVIFTPFLFDNFTEAKIQMIFDKLNDSLKGDGIWLFADFVVDGDSPTWQKLLLRIMYIFFRATGRIETQHLVKMDSYFSSGYHSTYERYYYAHFIRSVVYRKESSQRS